MADPETRSPASWECCSGYGSWSARAPSWSAGTPSSSRPIEQLELLPGLVAAGGIACGKARGFEADDFLAAAVRQELARGGTTVVATSDRDAFQLVSDRTVVLQPVKGVTETRRVGVMDVVERYGVRPDQVTDFIALRGDPSDKIPGAKGVGEKGAASLLAEYGSLECMLEAGRFAAEADALRRFKRIAELDPSAPLAELDDRQPDWGALADAVREIGLERLAGRLSEGGSKS
jgi:DNA polymerase I